MRIYVFHFIDVNLRNDSGLELIEHTLEARTVRQIGGGWPFASAMRTWRPLAQDLSALACLRSPCSLKLDKGPLEDAWMFTAARQLRPLQAGYGKVETRNAMQSKIEVCWGNFNCASEHSEATRYVAPTLRNSPCCNTAQCFDPAHPFGISDGSCARLLFGIGTLPTCSQTALG